MSEQKMAITTGKNGYLAKEAHLLAEYYQLDFVERQNKGLNKLMQMYDLSNIFVLSNDGLLAYALNNPEKLTFHPGMAVARLRLAKDGHEEPLYKAIAPFNGMRILDCTLGLASDAISMALYIGDEGQIYGLEASKALYIVTDYGLKNYVADNKKIAQAINKISVRNERYEDFFTQTNECFDVAYFDPMFDHGLYKSSGINALRPFADYTQLSQEILEQALHVAPKAVVKFRQNACLDLTFDEIIKGKYSPIAFGICYRR